MIWRLSLGFLHLGLESGVGNRLTWDRIGDGGRLVAMYSCNEEAFPMLMMVYPVGFTCDVNSQLNAARCLTAVCSRRVVIFSTCCCEMKL